MTVVHNETSTGVMSPLAEIAEVMRKYPDVSFIVDTVSSMSAVPLDLTALGTDVCLAGVQKAFGLPPGLAVFAVSRRALDKARTTPDRGYYFDFLEFAKNDSLGRQVFGRAGALYVVCSHAFQSGTPYPTSTVRYL